MADNIDITEGSGKTIATDDVSNAHYQRIKVDLGADGLASPLVRGQQNKAGSLPVTLASDEDAIVLGAGTAEIGKLAAGTAAIGKLAANDGVDIGDVDVASQPARVKTTDTITAALDTAALMNNTTALTPKFAVINATTNGNNTIVAAVTDKKIRVLSYSIVADAAVGVAFEDGAGGSDLSGQMAFAANGGIQVAFSPLGHFETASNTLLNLETDAVANVRGHLTYVEV